MHCGLSFPDQSCVAGAIGVMAYVNGHGPGASRSGGSPRPSSHCRRPMRSGFSPSRGSRRRPGPARADSRGAQAPTGPRARQRWPRPATAPSRPGRGRGPRRAGRYDRIRILGRFRSLRSTGQGIAAICASSSAVHPPGGGRSRQAAIPAHGQAPEARPSDATQVPRPRPGEPRQRRGARRIPSPAPPAPEETPRAPDRAAAARMRAIVPSRSAPR
jgi:hypothetical protein